MGSKFFDSDRLLTFLIIAASTTTTTTSSSPSNRSIYSVSCEGWRNLCVNVRRTRVPTARVNSSVVIDCLDGFSRTGFPADAEFVVNGWRFDSNASHFVDEDGQLHLENLAVNDSGVYTCDVGAPFANASASISWPLKVYVVENDWTELAVIWGAAGALCLLFMGGAFLQNITQPGVSGSCQGRGARNRVRPATEDSVAWRRGSGPDSGYRRVGQTDYGSIER